MAEVPAGLWGGQECEGSAGVLAQLTRKQKHPSPSFPLLERNGGEENMKY